MNKQLIFTALAVGMTLSSCQVLGIFNKDGQQARPVAPQFPAAVAQDTTKVTEGTPIAPTTPSTPTAPSAPTSAKLTGTWEIFSVGKDTIPAADEMPYLTFNPEEQRFYASNGCNIINGTYQETADNHLQLSQVLSTLRMCQDVPLQYEISAALGDDRNYTFAIQPSDGILTMTLVDTATGRRAMTLIHRHLTWLNGQWQVAKIGDKAYDDEEMNLYFDMPEMSVHGNTGCNYFNGSLTTDAAVPYSLNFGRMGVTKMACPDTSTETAMLVALEQTAACRPSGRNGAVLLSPSGRILMTLRRPVLQTDR